MGLTPHVRRALLFGFCRLALPVRVWSPYNARTAGAGAVSVCNKAGEKLDKLSGARAGVP